VLRALKSYRGNSDGALALAAGMSRSAVQGYMTNKTQLNIGSMFQFAKALDVHPSVFLMTPDEAIQWAIENSPNGEDGWAIRSRCNSLKWYESIPA
jgi:transcriptional regulator with XRE-family HTH domain